MKSNNKDLTIVSRIEEFYPKGLSKPILPSNYQPNMWGIDLETVNLRKGELPQENILRKYTIGINLGQNHSLEQTIDGKYKEAKLFKGCIGILPFQLPMWSCWDKDIEHLYLHLEPSLLARHSQELFKEEEFEIIHSVYPIEDPLIFGLGMAIKNELIGHMNGSRTYIESMADALAIHLLHNYSTITKSIKTYSGGLSPFKLKLVKEFINDNLHQEISIEQLSQLTKLSRYHFSRAFKQSIGISPHQYIIHTRVERAKQLLLQGKMTMVDIAIACGFNHQSHFNRHFKRLTGLTPKMFLKR